VDLNSLKDFVNNHPEGVRIRMADGTKYTVPHRDYIWFTPGYGQSEARVGRFATSFYVSDKGVARLVNALLVAEVMPLPSNGHGKSGKRGDRKKR
jgi:hypothetical protein